MHHCTLVSTGTSRSQPIHRSVYMSDTPQVQDNNLRKVYLIDKSFKRKDSSSVSMDEYLKEMKKSADFLKNESIPAKVEPPIGGPPMGVLLKWYCEWQCILMGVEWLGRAKLDHRMNGCMIKPCGCGLIVAPAALQHNERDLLDGLATRVEVAITITGFRCLNGCFQIQLHVV